LHNRADIIFGISTFPSVYVSNPALLASGVCRLATNPVKLKRNRGLALVAVERSAMAAQKPGKSGYCESDRVATITV